ncbi:MAG: molybdopterin-dependent oxidoreductase [Elusimicrobiota bacterium]
MIHLNIDGRKISVEPGATVLDAARKAGVNVPTLCDHAGLSPFGACRLCIVEVEGKPGVSASCSTPAADGMTVLTDTENLRALRKGIMELLISEHPNSCLICADKMDCWENHECTRRAEITTGCKFCPQTGRCEFQNAVHQVYGDKGASTKLPSRYKNIPVERRDPFIDQDDNLCILCGRCVRACADVEMNNVLDFMHRGSQSRVGTPFNRPLTESGCVFCGACVDVCPTGSLSERVRRWEGPAESSIASTCSYCSVGCQLELGVKGGRVVDSTPRRDGSLNEGHACVRGRFSVVEFTRSVKRLKHPMVRRNGELIEVPWETAVNAVAEGILRSKPEKSAVVYSGSCSNEDVYAAHKFARDVMKTKNVDNSLRLSYGPLTDGEGAGAPAARIADLADAAAVLIVGADPDFSHPVLAHKIKKSVSQGKTRLVIMSPSASRLSPLAACEIRYAPGAEKDTLDLLRARAVRKKVAESNGHIDIAAKILRRAGSVVIVYGTGLMRRMDGAANRDAVAALAKAVSAKVMPLFSRANDRGAQEIAASFEAGGLRTPEIFQAARCAKEPLDFLYLVGEDVPPGDYKAKFTVVQDMFLPAEAGKFADVVFPVAGFVEAEGTYVNLEGRIQRARRAAKPLGTSKTDWEILAAVAKKIGAAGFEYAEASEIMTELAKNVPFFKGVTFKALSKEGATYGKPAKAGKKVKAKKRSGLRMEHPERPDKNYPFSLVAEYDEFAYKSTPLAAQVPGIARIQQPAAVVLSPRDAESMGIGSGTPVSVISRRGRLAAKAVVSQDAREGVARMVARGGEASPALVMNGLLDPASKSPDEMCAVRIEKL